MSRTFRGDHDHIKVGSRLDLLEMNVEAMGERERCTLLDVRLDFLEVNLLVVLVGKKDHDEIGTLHRIGDFLHL